MESGLFVDIIQTIVSLFIQKFIYKYLIYSDKIKHKADDRYCKPTRSNR